MKSTSEACKSGNSNLVEHVKKMENYIKNNINLDARKKEAIALYNNYAVLELRGLVESDKIKETEFQKLEPEIMLIFTDQAINYYEENKEAIGSMSNAVVATFNEKVFELRVN